MGKPVRKKWVACPLEEQYCPEDSKAHKRERKKVRAKDRSRFKKSEQKDETTRSREELEAEGWQRGRVLSIQGQEIHVEEEAHTLRICVLRGVLKKERQRLKNLVTVGDWVWFEVTGDSEGAITHVEERKSVLSRSDNLTRRAEQLIAANIDQVLITVSLVRPPLKPGLIDRYLIATRKGKMRPVLLINKMDLLEEEEEERHLLDELLHAYRQAGEEVLCVSTKTGEGIDALRARMQGFSSVFSGQSGVGKSSLINTVTGLDLATNETVEKTRKGSHTTTTAQLIPLEGGGWCIDTPGIKSFGLWDLQVDEIEQHFGEIHRVGAACKFASCTHIHEPHCAVIEAVEREEISAVRYDSYVALWHSVQEQYLRR